jgi:predicted methyltransferase
MRVTFSQPGITSDIEVADEERVPLVNRFHGDGWFTRALAQAAKRFGLVAVGFGSNQFTVG